MVWAAAFFLCTGPATTGFRDRRVVRRIDIKKKKAARGPERDLLLLPASRELGGVVCPALSVANNRFPPIWFHYLLRSTRRRSDEMNGPASPARPNARKAGPAAAVGGVLRRLRHQSTGATSGEAKEFL